MKKHNTKSLVFRLSYAVSNFFTKNSFLRILGLPIRLTYKLLIQWVLGIDIPDTLKIGKNFKIYHGQGLIVHKNSVIGDNVTLRHNTTIGVAKTGGKCPIIEDNVDVGANSVIIGDIKIGKNSKIGAGSIVVKDVEPNSIVVGNQARKLSK